MLSKFLTIGRDEDRRVWPGSFWPDWVWKWLKTFSTFLYILSYETSNFSNKMFAVFHNLYGFVYLTVKEECMKTWCIRKIYVLNVYTGFKQKNKYIRKLIQTVGRVIAVCVSILHATSLWLAHLRLHSAKLCCQCCHCLLYFFFLIIHNFTLCRYVMPCNSATCSENIIVLNALLVNEFVPSYKPTTCTENINAGFNWLEKETSRFRTVQYTARVSGFVIESLLHSAPKNSNHGAGNHNRPS